MIQTIQLAQGVTLQCFPDHRFKQSCLSLQLLRPMCREEAALNAILPAILLRGCQSAPDLRDITLHLDDLYGASVGALVRRIGDYQTTGLYCSFMEDKYALEADAILEPMVAFLGELMFQPVLENGAFRREYVESEKKNLISAIESQRNDKRSYAAGQLLRHMCQDDSFGLPRLGEISQVSAITAQALYHHYRKILSDSPVLLFYVGSADPRQVADLLKPLFSHRQTALPAQTAFTAPGGIEKTERMDVTQGRLCMGFTTTITTRDEDFVAMQLCNLLFGGGMTSKLFMQVREKLSLCYDIGSGYHSSKGIMTVTAGIDCRQEALTRQEILTQLQACQNGDFTEEEFLSAQQALLSQLQSLHDSPGAIEGYYTTCFLSGLPLTPEQYMAKARAVTPEQVAQAAKTLSLHTVYFLKGVQS